MYGNELKKLSRSDLLEMLIEQVKENDKLKAELEEKDRQLNDKNIKIRECGSIAEAALKLNGVFEAAQAAAQQYIENIKSASRVEQPGKNGKDENNESEK